MASNFHDTFGLCWKDVSFQLFHFMSKCTPPEMQEKWGEQQDTFHLLFNPWLKFMSSDSIFYQELLLNSVFLPACFLQNYVSPPSGRVILIDEWTSGPVSEKIKWSLGKYIECTYSCVPSHLSKDRILSKMRILFSFLGLLVPFRVEKYFILIWKGGWR